MDAGQSAIRSSPVVIAQHFTKATHIRIAIYVPKQVQQKQAWRIVTRRRYRGVAVGHQGTDERKIDQRGDHPAHAAFDIAVWKDLHKTFFKPVKGKQVEVWERGLMGKRNIYVDFVEFFAYSADGEFMKRVHHTPFNPGGRCYFCPDYSFMRLRRIESLSEVFPQWV